MLSGRIGRTWKRYVSETSQGLFQSHSTAVDGEAHLLSQLQLPQTGVVCVTAKRNFFWPLEKRQVIPKWFPQLTHMPQSGNCGAGTPSCHRCQLLFYLCWGSGGGAGRPATFESQITHWKHGSPDLSRNRYKFQSDETSCWLTSPKVKVTWKMVEIKILN